MAELQGCVLCKTTVNKDEQSILERYLPEGYSHNVCEFERTGDSAHSFKAVLRLAMDRKEDAVKWLSELQEKSCTTWRVNKTYPDSSYGTRRKNDFRADYRCHHNTHPRARTTDRCTKNTNCPALLYLIVKRSSDKRGRVRSTDEHLSSGLMTVCRLNNNHNHEIHSLDSLRRRDVSSSVREKLIQLFKSGHTPATALETFRCDLQGESGEDFLRLSADRHSCPDKHYFYRQYSIFRKEHGQPTGSKMLRDLELKLEKYNQEQGSTCSSFDTTEDGQTVVAICSPLMKRIHQYWPYSGELCFFEASATMDRPNCRAFLVLTHSPAGGLPLGAVISSSSDSEGAMAFGLEKLKSLLPEAAFYGRGARGPMAFVTSDSTAERTALRSCFPESCVLLCVFHVLEALWRWLWEQSNGIVKSDRPLLLQKVKDMVYAETVPELDLRYSSALSDAVCQRYPSFLQRLGELYDRKDEWAIAFRKELLVRNINFAETAMQIRKEKVLCRTKAFNLCKLVDYVTTKLNHYYQRKLADVSNNRWSESTMRLFPNDTTVIPDEAVTKTSEHEYEVKSQKKDEVHGVNLDLGLCTCRVGRSGPCKHQAAVAKRFSVDTRRSVSDPSPELRALMNQMATGNENMNKNWFRPLQSSRKRRRRRRSHSEEEEVVEPAVTDMSDADDDPIMIGNYETVESPVIFSGLGAQSELLAMDDGHDANQRTRLKEQLRQIFVDLDQKLEREPETFAGALEAFVSSYSRISSRSRLVSALRGFGKSSKPKTP